MLGIYLQAFIYSTVCSQFHTTTKTKPANSTRFLLLMFLMNFYRREKHSQAMKRKLKRQHDKCLFFKTVWVFIQLSRENLLPPNVSLQSDHFWSGLFCTLWLSATVLLDDSLIKAESSGASKVLICSILICSMVSREAALILLLILQIFPANFKIYAEMADLFSML